MYILILIHNSMNWAPTYPAGLTTFQTFNQGSVNLLGETIRIIQNYDYPPPEGYKFIKPLGVGSCGRVYRAESNLTGCSYAVKCVKIFDTYTAELARCLWNEVMIMRANPHTHLLKCYGAMQSPTDLSIWYLFLEYMDKGTVRDWYMDINTDVNEAGVRKCISQVLQGLVHLHALCIVHRDIKGDNILKDSNGFYKIADFGLTKQCYRDDSSGNFGLMTGGIGTPSHMAPEIHNKHILYDMKADIWSLGCLALEILNKGPPTLNLNNQTVFALPPFTPITPQCEDFIQKCLQVNPSNRPTSSCLSVHPWFAIQLSD